MRRGCPVGSALSAITGAITRHGGQAQGGGAGGTAIAALADVRTRGLGYAIGRPSGRWNVRRADASKVVRDQSVKAAALATPLEEAELVEQCRKGNLTAFGRLIAQYQDRVLNTCWRMCGSREEAEDLTQEAFVRAYQSIGQFAGRSRFSTWVFRIAVNLAISERRKARGRRVISLDQDGDGRGTNSPSASAAERPASSETSPSDHLLSRERERSVLAALAELDDESRALVVLRDVEDLSYSEIAEILGIPTGTVKSRLHRTRLALRERLVGTADTA